MTRRFDGRDPQERASGVAMAASVVRRGGLVLLPTDTAYAVVGDAFSPTAVSALLEAKGRARSTPVPVLVPSATTLMGVLDHVGDDVKRLTEAFWPGGLTLVARAAPSLTWDLGDTRGTVTVRQPLHPLALEVLSRTGPLAAMTANVAGGPVPMTAAEADDALGGRRGVEVLLDGGPALDAPPSTIVDVTHDRPLLVREGAIGVDDLLELVPDLEVLA